MVEWLTTFSHHAHLKLDCPLLQLPPAEVVAHASYLWTVLEALRPSPILLSLVQTAVARLHAIGNTETFTFLHLRIENDWLGHCFRWSHYPVIPCGSFVTAMSMHVGFIIQH